MAEPAYPAARIVAEKVHALLRERRQSFASGSEIASLPSAEVIENLVDVAFWTSLRREEQHPPRVALAYVSPEQTKYALSLERGIPLSPPALTRVAPGSERPGVYLAVSQVDAELRVWGITRKIPIMCLVVESLAPGLLVIKHRHSDETAKFVNMAVIEGDQVKILDYRFSAIPSCPTIVGTLLGLDSFTSAARDTSNVLIRLAVSMRSHGRGGSLLIVPADSEKWRDSIAKPINYSVQPAYTELSTLIREGPGERSQRKWNDVLSKVVESIAGFTAIDGATVITDAGDLLAFGAKIMRRHGSSVPEKVVVTEPIEGAPEAVLHPTQLGGTRHLSAAQFAFDQRESIALVASQDGPFTVFSWADCYQTLYGYRVESLLL